MSGEMGVDQGYEKLLSGYGPMSWYIRWYLRHRPAREMPLVLAQLGAGPFPRLLDAGCAGGIWLGEAYRLGQGRELLAGADLSDMLVHEARKRLAHEAPGTTVRIERTSAVAMPFQDGSFDAIMTNGMVKHLAPEDFERFLAEARRLLVPGGRLSVWDFGRLTIPEPKFDPSNPALSIRHCTLRTSERFMELLAEAGFTDISAYGLPKLRRLPVTLEGAVGTRA